MIYGVMARGGERVPPDWIAAMDARAAKWPADYSAHGTAHCGHIAIRERTAYAGAPSQGMARVASKVLVFDGRIDNRAELIGELQASDATDAELALAALEKWGETFARHLVGDYAIAALDTAAPLVTLTRDAMGIRPLFVAETGDFIAFASNMDVLLALPWVDRRPDTAWLVDCMEQIKGEEPYAPYRGIRIVRPAHSLTITSSESSEIRHWSPPPLDNILDITAEEAVAEYRRLFDQAVASRLPARGVVATEFSGGIDSGAITLTAAPMLADRGQRFMTLSHVLDGGEILNDTFQDEREQIEAMRAVMPATDHRWLDERPESQLALTAQMIARHGGPAQRDFAFLQPRLAEIMREEDCRVILSGHGGDQCATSQGEGYGESLAHAGDWQTLAQIADWKWRLLWRTGAGRAILKRRAFARREAVLDNRHRVTNRRMISDATLRARHAAHPMRPLWGTIGEREREVIASPHIAQRTQDTAVGSGPDGFAHTYPMLDTRLVEFCLRVPDLLKRTPTRRRVLVRGAMEGRMPESVRLRDHKQGGASMPVAVSGFYPELTQMRALFEECRNTWLGQDLLDFETIIAELEEVRTSLKPSEKVRTGQFRKAAQLCLWLATDDPPEDPA